MIGRALNREIPITAALCGFVAQTDTASCTMRCLNLPTVQGLPTMEAIGQAFELARLSELDERP
jgi:hypothetical protein